MIRKFFKDSFVYSISNFLAKGISLFLVPIYTKKLSASDYGTIDLFVIFGAFAAILVGLEITQALARFFTDTQDELLKKSYASTSLWFTVLSYFLFFVVFYGFRNQLNMLITGDEKWLNVYLLAISSISVRGIMYFSLNQLKWMFESTKYALVNILYVIVSFGLASYLIVYKDLALQGYFIGTLVGGTISSILGLFFGRRYYNIEFDSRNLITLLKYSIPLIFSSLAVILSIYTDRIIIKDLLGNSQLGIYGIAYRFAAVVSLVLVGFRSALTPLIYTYYKEPSTPQKIETIYRFFFFASITGILFITIFSYEIVKFLTAPQFFDAWKPLPLISIGILFASMYIFAPGLGIARKTHLKAIVNIVFLGLNVVLNYLLIPRYGLIGASLATAVSAIFSFATYMLLSQRYYKIPYKYHHIVLALLVLGLAYLGTFVINNENTLRESNVILIKMGVVLLIMFFFAVIFISKEEMSTILKKLKSIT